MNLFTLGPVNMSDEIRKIGSNPIPYFRTKEFSEIMLKIESSFLHLLDCKKESKFAMLTASGSGAMEAVVANVFTKEDNVLIIDGGSFGHRFVLLCECYEIPYEVIKLEFGEALTEDKMLSYCNKGFTALLVNIHETSTGQLYDYRMLGEFCKANNMFYIVDAVSSFLADEFSMLKGGVDISITSSQKGLALPPGLSFVVVSNKKLLNRIKENKRRTLYFALNDYFEDMKRGQTPFTPAVGITLQLYYQLEKIKNIKIEQVIEYHKNLADEFRRCCKNYEIKIADYPMSNAVTTLICSNSNALEIIEEIKCKYDDILTPSGGWLKNKIIRVGHLGQHQKNEYRDLAENLKTLL